MGWAAVTERARQLVREGKADSLELARADAMMELIVEHSDVKVIIHATRAGEDSHTDGATPHPDRRTGHRSRQRQERDPLAPAALLARLAPPGRQQPRKPPRYPAVLRTWLRSVASADRERRSCVGTGSTTPAPPRLSVNWVATATPAP